MAEKDPDNWLSEHDLELLANPPRPGRIQRFKDKAGHENIRTLTSLLASAALLIAGSQAKELKHNLDYQQSESRVACYKESQAQGFNSECTNEILAISSVAATIVSVIGFVGGAALTGEMLVTQYRRREVL